MELFKVISVENTYKMLEEEFQYNINSEIIHISSALGRIVYEDIVSHENVPSFRRSTVDGYAVKAKDVAGASETMPAMMEIKGEVVMGKEPKGSIQLPGEAIYIPTGGMIPEGADSMVMIEHTEKLDDTTLLVNKSSAYGDHVIDIGEDIKQGEIVVKKGAKLRPYEIGALSSIGITNVKVVKKPKVAIISTGDEVISPECNPNPGQVRNINSSLLHSLILENGGQPIDYGVIKDDFELLKDTVHKALEECEVLLVSGGSSVGKKDETINVINSFSNSKLLVHGISIKPGKPTIIARVDEKPIFGLPGHPLSCALIYKVIVKHYIDSLLQIDNTGEYGISVDFGLNYHSAKGREEYLPVQLIKKEKNRLIAMPVFGKSGLITGFSKAWGIVKIEKNVEGLAEGEKVLVYKI